jgi:hypothetical protein
MQVTYFLELFMQTLSAVGTASLSALMSHLIDYAGLFPPAKLPLEEALANYFEYLGGPDRWMLGRFVIKGSQIDAARPLLDRLIAQVGKPDGLRFSVLGSGNGWTADLPQIDRLRAVAEIDAYEVEFPPADRGFDAVQSGIALFYEISSGDATLEAGIAAIARAKEIGFKLRCGGVIASAFPTTQQIARAIVLCREYSVPMKMTAGLHHPIRHFDPSVQTKMHGFLNVFGAGVLAYVHKLDLPAVQAILDDENADHFHFTDTAFTWGTWSATPEQITALRRTALLSYGSCSFDDPRHDLQALGLLAEQHS